MWFRLVIIAALAVHSTAAPVERARRLSTTGPAIVRQNFGGVDFLDSFGNLWTERTDIGNEFFQLMPVNIVDSELYQTELSFRNPRTLTFAVPVADQGPVCVTLKFAELFETSVGARVFDINIQGTQVVNDLDIFAQVGGLAPLDLSFTVRCGFG